MSKKPKGETVATIKNGAVTLNVVRTDDDAVTLFNSVGDTMIGGTVQITDKAMAELLLTFKPHQL